ncbi:hypothetical protein OTU49_012685 [Cherax quadricarinatus]|uniref:Uncharacterized protein n=1 Tax=Cherax quadricarinatus TaxID=27406 RepID=A0AAW0YKU7_CHEQU
MTNTKRDDPALCCCEYINEDGELAHLLTTLCNCEAIDEAFERLDTCVSHINDRWFVTGLTFGLFALCYGVHLSLTTVCHPRLVDLYFITVLVPHNCPDAFMNFQSSLSISAACYGILIAIFVAVALIQQLVCVMSGVRLSEFRKRRQLPNQPGTFSVKNGLRNCLNFWWRQ